LEMLGPEDFHPRLLIDAVVEWEELTMRLAGELESLAPFGPANPEPTLLLRGVSPIGPRIVGTDHLKCRVRKGPRHPRDGKGEWLDVIGFRMGDRLPIMDGGAELDLAFTPERNSWQGRESLQLRLKDVRVSQQGTV